jgi:UDP-N-acetylglucosamine 2-epimerase
LEESKMRLDLKRMIVAFAAVALLGTGSVFASPPAPSPGALETDKLAYLSERASMLLAEIKTQTAELGPDADTLGTFARNPHLSWQSHAFYLDRVKGHINAIGERTAELQQIRYAVLPWQEQAITEVTSHAAQVAASTQAAIVYLNENQGRRFVPEYRDHLTTIADSSEDMKQAVDKFLAYEKTQQKLQDLQNELDLGG